jgi:hypothetical protein
VALEQRFLRDLRFYCVNVIPTGSPHSSNIWGMKNRPVGGRSSKTYTHSIDMNNKHKLIVVIPVNYNFTDVHHSLL